MKTNVHIKLMLCIALGLFLATGTLSAQTEQKNNVNQPVVKEVPKAEQSNNSSIERGNVADEKKSFDRRTSVEQKKTQIKKKQDLKTMRQKAMQERRKAAVQRKKGSLNK